MVKKIIITLIVILVLGAVVFIGIMGAILPWHVTRGDQSITTADAFALTQMVLSTLTALTSPTRETANLLSSPTLIIDTLNTTSRCFASEEILPITFTPEADKPLVRTSSGRQVFELQTGKEATNLKASQNVIVAALAPDRQTLAWSMVDNTIQLVRISDQKILVDLIGHPDPVYHLQFFSSSDRLFSASYDVQVRIWDMSGRQVVSINAGDEVVGIGLSMDGKKLSTIPSDGPMLLRELAGHTKIKEIGGSGDYDTSNAHFTPDGQYLIADLAPGLFLWSISDVNLVWNDFKNSIAVTFSPNARYLSYSDIDAGNKVSLASPDGAKVIRSIEGMRASVWELFFSPDSSLLAATDVEKFAYGVLRMERCSKLEKLTIDTLNRIGSS
jgi:WD40 repeat protein